MEYRHVKQASSCKVCHKKLQTEKNDGERIICFYTRIGRGMYVHICKQCVCNMLEVIASHESPEVVEDNEFQSGKHNSTEA